MIPARVRALLATAALGLLPFLAFSGTPDAAATVLVAATASPTADPSPTMILPLPSPTPSASPTPEEPSPTPVATTAAPTVSPTPRKTSAPVRTASPRPRATQTETVTSTAAPVTGGLDVGVVPEATEASPTSTPIGTRPAASRSSTDKVARLITLVVGGAVLLGAGGAAGLYLTRHRG